MSKDASAFPNSWTVTVGTVTVLENHEPGMTLREWFSGQALAGMMGNLDRTGSESETAAEAYALADAMMTAREE